MRSSNKRKQLLKIFNPILSLHYRLNSNNNLLFKIFSFYMANYPEIKVGIIRLLLSCKNKIAEAWQMSETTGVI